MDDLMRVIAIILGIAVIHGILMMLFHPGALAREHEDEES